jgi:CCR4-NOT transcription complex subunit 7/8
MAVAGFPGAGASDGGGTGLASHAAQMGFARGAQMQQQQLHQGHDGRLALENKAGAVKSRIRDVWKHNLAHEMAVLRQLVDKYPYISMVRT